MMLVTLGLCLLQTVAPPRVQELQEMAPWVLSHAGVQARIEGDLILETIRQPVLKRDGIELRASMALFWLDRQALLDRRIRTGETLDLNEPQDLFETFVNDPASAILKEVYFEGPIEYLLDGERVGYAKAMYLNPAEQRGWIADAELLLERNLKDRAVTWSARAEWMQRQPDGTLRSNDAVISTCGFVDQHLFVKTKSLEVVRADADDPGSFSVALRGNSLEAYGLARLPLPPFVFEADDKGMPLVPELRLGSSARFGTFVETGLSFDASALGSGIHGLLGGNRVDPKTGASSSPRSDGHVGLSWLGSRGILLDLGLRLEAEDRYEWDMAIGGLFDEADDRGLIRVDPVDRGRLRTWTRSRGRFFLEEKSWLDLAISTESDPGVQSEFWEKSFIDYEERENYVHWRRADGADYFAARFKVRLDSARTQTEEWPSLRALFDRRPVLDLFDSPLLYSSSSSLSWLHRVEGDPAYQSPFAQQAPFTDGFGDRHSLRADTSHRLEAPLLVGSAWKLTPYLETRATAWDQDTLQDEQPTRVDLNAGVRLATTFWKRFDGGTTAQLAPFLEANTNLLHETSGGLPVVFDSVDFDTGVDSQAVGLRARLFGWREDEEFDMEVSTRHLEKGAVDDLQALDLFAGLQTHAFGMPVGLSHDARYELSSGGTLVSHATLGLRPTESLGLELSHSRGLDETFAPYYEAATVRGLYRWTPKWEFEGSQTVSILEDTSLVHEILMRRYGHDLVFEFGVSRVSGEGGTTFTLKVRPELLFRRSPIGYANHR